MNKEDYSQSVQNILQNSSEDVINRLIYFLSIIPKKVNCVLIYIFIDQDGEGFLNIRCDVEGIDSYKWNSTVGQGAYLFETKMTETGLEPPLPLMNNEDEDFDIRDVLTDVAMDWLEKELSKINLETCEVGIKLVPTEDNGTKGQIIIKEENKSRTKRSTLIQKLLRRF